MQEYDVFYGHYPKKLYAKNMQIYLKGLGADDGEHGIKMFLYL